MGAPKSPGTVTQTNTVKLGPEQKKVFDLAFPSIEAYAASTPTLFPGTGVAPFNPTEVAGQQALLGAAGSPLVGAGANAQQVLLDPSQMLAPNQYVNAAADATVQRTTQNLMENILPQIRSGSTVAGGAYSGGATRQGVAEGRAIEGTNQQLSNALADMYLKNYSTGLSAMTQAIGQNPSVLQTQLFPGSVMGAVGGQQRGLEQAQLDEEIRKFYTAQDLDLSKSQQLLNLISGMPGGTGTSTVTGAYPQQSPLMQALGLGTTALGLFSGMPGMGLGMGMGK